MLSKQNTLGGIKMKSEMIRGAYVTLITPFDEEGNIDEACLRKLVNFQIENGIRGICPMGVTGETAALTDEEKMKVISIVADEVNGRVQVIPDVGTECFTRTLALAKRCETLNVEAIIILAPYLDTPTEEGLYQYFYQMAENLTTPILLHNVPGRTGVNISPEIIARLADHPNIIGIKDGNTTVEHVMEVLRLTKGKDFSVLTGKDTLGYPLLKLGGHGQISVAANLLPNVIVDIINSSQQGDFEKAYELYDKYYILFKNLYIQTNPIAVKYFMKQILFDVGEPRIPLTPLDEKNAGNLNAILKQVGLKED